MNHIRDDPELAQEMVQLLGNEVKQLRQKLREADTRRETETKPTTLVLEEVNNALRIEVANLRSQLEERSSVHGVQDDHAVARLKEKLKSRKLKHKETEEALRLEVENIMSVNQELQSDLESIRQELEATKSELLAVTEVRDKKPENFDLETFLSDPEIPPNYQDPPIKEPEKLPLHRSQEFEAALRLQSGIANATWRFKAHDVLWSTAGPGHWFVPSLAYTYDHKLGGMKHTQFSCDAGSTVDLFCSGENSTGPYSQYYGTYECTRVVAMDYSTIENSSQQLAQSIRRRMFTKKEMVPPIISDLVEKLYTDGTLKVHCMVLQCVGYNHAVYDKITGKAPKIVPVPGLKSSSSTKQFGRKRSRDQQGSTNTSASEHKKLRHTSG